ncbi:tetratricopeptide repeat protein [Treponema primitia ZAS-2]|uniref:Tetratricopeptide repeat protein n=1 Tax=Treponema primitia (strain ATCC BAA-887 / DSM 12427 / ZAS-2) TaxID=545694 RepID=F5YR87_TREPZ|nr:tetratricopeptide repeat protein [Treponema primitia]AEF83588.1 tetratricopeptide repeat protein [Treponema primitia ZAS-2]
MKRPALLLFFSIFCFFSCASGGVTTAEEYYSLGMAYFDMGKYAEAEKWLNRARMMDKTKVASEYNLGRIAFETGRYQDAVRHFDRILAKDKDNVMALKAAAYTRIKTSEFVLAEGLYSRVLTLEPESVDQGYNYALVLMALEKPEQAEDVLLKYQVAMADNKDTLLLLARARKALNKVEAVDDYNEWLQTNSDNTVRYEYAQVLESAQFYARALEEYRTVVNALPQGQSASPPVPGTLDRASVRFTIARLLLIADPEKTDGITELETAITDGFSDTEKLEILLTEPGISAASKDEIHRVIENLEKAKLDAEKAEAEKAEAEAKEPPEDDGQDSIDDAAMEG